MQRERLVQWLQQVYLTSETEIDCDTAAGLLPQYVESELAGTKLTGRLASVAVHLTECPDCCDEYRGLHEIVSGEAHGHLPQTDELLDQFEPAPRPKPVESRLVAAAD